MNLYEITETIQKLKDKADRGELDLNALKDTLDSLEDARNAKLDGLAGWYDSNTSDIAFLTNRIKDLTSKKDSLVNTNKRIMDYMTETIDAAGYKEMKTEHHILRPRNYRASTIIEDKSLVPEEFKETKEVTSVKRDLIYKALKAGDEVPGATLKPNRRTTIL